MQPVLNTDFSSSSKQRMQSSAENGVPPYKKSSPTANKDATSSSKVATGRQRGAGRDSYHPATSYYPGYSGMSRGKRSSRVDSSMAPYGLSPGLLKFYGPAEIISSSRHPKQGQFQNHGPTLHSSKDRICHASSRIESRDESTRNGDYERSEETTSGSHGRICNASSRIESRYKSTRNGDYERSEETTSGSHGRIWNASSRIESRDKSTRNGDYERSEETTSGSHGRIRSGSSRIESRDKSIRNGDYERSEETTSDDRGRIWNGNSRTESRDKSTTKVDYEGSKEIICGPRVNKRNGCLDSISVPSSIPGLGDKYNLAEFQTEYECAKFYVIKSFSEDDVQKCIKYDVWSSTAIGNKKLDAAFHDAEVKGGKFGKCPIFLFFSVNGSGQFVGLAEMVGKVDFNKTMDFWQLCRWSGFFPVKWHIIKDIPNGQLRHITLENNENRPVTFTRDTQEIGLKEGLKMLKIFKNYPAKSSLLDDFEFYEERLKALDASKSGRPATHRTNVYTEDLWNYADDMSIKGKGPSKTNRASNHSSPLVDLTKKLSINSSEHKVGR